LPNIGDIDKNLVSATLIRAYLREMRNHTPQPHTASCDLFDFIQTNGGR